MTALLLVLAALFLGWELVATVLWLGQTGGIGEGFAHLWQALRSDWMALIVVSDHLLVAGTVLIGLWLDTRRLGWRLARRLLLAVAFVALGSPALLAYLAWRMGRGDRAAVAA
ncbi:MAG TPA: hypothetical protein VEB59_03545 [Gemmatimonadales bacterium]|nr:hypothetical protein [Gemmatimonadales bacterium]